MRQSGLLKVNNGVASILAELWTRSEARSVPETGFHLKRSAKS